MKKKLMFVVVVLAIWLIPHAFAKPEFLDAFNITGFKINGTDENGTGIPNWTINLFDNNGTNIATTTTEEDGWYSFTNLTNGTYNVTEELMQGWTNVTPMTQEVIIDNSDESDVNFTNMVISAAPSNFTISGFKLNETNESDIGIENWNIMLLDSNDSQIATTETGADGSYNFTDLGNGTYIVKEGTMQGWTNISPMIQEVVIDNKDESDVNFTNMLSTVAPLNISSESPESPFVSNVNESVTFEIKLNQVANVSWNLDGMSVENEDNTMLSDYTNSNASIAQHTLDVDASNSNGEDSFEWIWTVQNAAPSVENVGIISGIVFNDKNHNGKKDKGEKGISGINVTLKGLDPSNKGIIMSKKTDKSGKYIFKNLSNGHYRIILGHKKGFKPTTGTSKKVNLIPKITVNFGDRKP